MKVGLESEKIICDFVHSRAEPHDCFICSWWSYGQVTQPGFRSAIFYFIYFYDNLCLVWLRA